MSDVAAICGALAARISSMEMPDGRCPAFLSSDPLDFSQAESCGSIFPTALALTSLCHTMPDKRLAPVIQTLVQTLLRERTERSSFNYWARTAEDRLHTPYPDDLDTTVCCLSALQEALPGGLDGSVLAQSVLMLVGNEQAPGGPYRTWLVPPEAPEAWKDIDVAVNANIGRYLAFQHVELPELTAYIGQQLHADTFVSPYYPSEIAILYFLSSWYPGPHVTAIQRLHLLQRGDGSWESPLQTAWALIALLRWEGLSPSVIRGFDWLCAQDPDVHSGAYALCTHAVSVDQRIFLGSSMVTLSACLEAGSLYLQMQEVVMNDQARSTHRYDRYHAALMDRIIARLQQLPESIQQPAFRCLQELREADTRREIALLPVYVVGSLHDSYRERLSSEITDHLCEANVFGWMAYTVYDDLLDEEGDIALLPLANIFLREVVTLFQRAVSIPTFRETVRTVLDELEAANADEVRTCRLTRSTGGWHVPIIPMDVGSAGVLSRRSFGHALGPLAILHACGIGPDHVDYRLVNVFFIHYLHARQADDDVHDWEEDLMHGRLNSVTLDLLPLWQQRHGAKEIRSEHFSDLRRLFWEERAVVICTDILDRCDRASAAIRQVTMFSAVELFERMLEPVRASARLALKEREQMVAFLSAYHPNV